MAALLFLFSFLLFAAPPDPQAEGLQALDQQNYSRAEEIFQKLTVADPKDYTAVFYLALAETGSKHDDQAIEHYKQTLVLKPGLYEAELNLAMVYLRNQKPADAAPLLREAVKQKPDQVRPQRYLGDSLLATGDFAGAAEAYQDALKLDPKLASANLGLGQSLVRQGELDEAAPYYRQAVTLDPKLQSYLLELGVAFAKANRTDDAILLLKEFPKDPGAREELGRLYLETNRPALAVPEFQAAVELSPTPANQLSLATAYLKNNQPDLASPILEQALVTAPNDFDLHMAVGKIRRDKHDYGIAAKQFLAAAQLKPDSVEAWNELATSSILGEQYEQGLAALDQIHRLNAEKAGNFYLRAIVLDKFHQVKPALANYQRFLELSQGKFPDEEFKARQRSRILEKEASR